ncbi:holo-[acyl-carrier-protein] synthase [Candidatus Magnetomorum sp. HK-1]|nr:holo-[acyl-carrier-protein] synthase [Candidatus Magnetomorum sp. HK-1]
MIHVGNDIVDLASPFAHGKCRDQKFVNRVLTNKEQKVIQGGQFDNRLLWTYWAAKESAFKVISKIQPNVSSSPRNYEVSFDGDTQLSKQTGVVNTPVSHVHFCANTYVSSGKEWIHCVGSSKELDNGSDIVYRAKQIDHLFDYHFSHASKNESSHVRKVAGKKIAELLSESPKDVVFRKNAHKGEQPYPKVYLQDRKTNIDVSFSHDGRFVAYAFCLN